MGVGGGDEVEQGRFGQESFAVIGGGVGSHGSSPIHDAGKEIERAGADIADEAEDIEDVSAIGLIDAAVHAQADEEHAEHRDQQQQAADVALEQEVASAGESQPTIGATTDMVVTGYSGAVVFSLLLSPFRFLFSG